MSPAICPPRRPQPPPAPPAAPPRPARSPPLAARRAPALPPAPRESARAVPFAPSPAIWSSFPWAVWSRLLARPWRHPAPALAASLDRAGPPAPRLGASDRRGGHAAFAPRGGRDAGGQPRHELFARPGADYRRLAAGARP